MYIPAAVLRYAVLFRKLNFDAIDALNLSSFEYSGDTTMDFDVTAPRLLKVFWNTAKRKKCLHSPFGAIAQ